MLQQGKRFGEGRLSCTYLLTLSRIYRVAQNDLKYKRVPAATTPLIKRLTYTEQVTKGRKYVTMLIL
jgi:hypothetical protein